MNDYKELIAHLRSKSCTGCPWFSLCVDEGTDTCVCDTEAADAIERLVRERDAAVEDLRGMKCASCKHLSVSADDKPCKSCRRGFWLADNWEWRGVQDEQAN